MGLSRLRTLVLAAALVGAATSGLGAESVGAVPAFPDITAAPTKIARTAGGPVGYREVGNRKGCTCAGCRRPYGASSRRR